MGGEAVNDFFKGYVGVLRELNSGVATLSENLKESTAETENLERNVDKAVENSEELIGTTKKAVKNVKKRRSPKKPNGRGKPAKVTPIRREED